MAQAKKVSRKAVEKIVELLAEQRGAAAEAVRLSGKSGSYYRTIKKRDSMDLVALLAALEVMGISASDFFADIEDPIDELEKWGEEFSDVELPEEIRQHLKRP